MSYRGLFLALTLVVFSGSRADAQGLCSTSAQGKVACTITNVFGVNGLTPAGGALFDDGHRGHFGDDFLTNLGPLNASIGSQLGQLPLVSPASGLSFSIGKSGNLVASDFNFGPILTERAGTIGRHRLVVGFSYQYFDFDTLDGLDLSNLHSVYTHQDLQQGPSLNCTIKPVNPTDSNTGLCAFVRDTIVTTSNIGLHVSQYTTFLSFGVTSKFDISVAIPVVAVSMSDTATATIHNNGSDNLHQFADPATGTECLPNPCFNRTFTNSSGATGIGDVTIRAKYNFLKRERVGVSVGGDVRFPTGDSLNFLGAGAYGIRPFGVVSYSYKRLSTNFNIGYEWNGKSYLAGNIAPDATTGQAPFKASLPNDFFFTFGGEIGIVKKLSAGVDYIGQHVFDTPRVQTSTFSELGACTVPPPPGNNGGLPTCNTFFPDGTVKDANFNTFRGSYTASNISIGLRYRPFSKFLLTANVIRRLDDAGLRAKLIPLAGITYTH